MNINSRGRSCLRLLLVGLTLCGTVTAALTGWTLEPAARISPERSGHDLAHHAKFLASAELGGRGVGSDGIDSARDYIAAEFAKHGLRPGGENGFFQSFDVAVGVTVNQPSGLRLGNGEPLSVHEEWIPLGLSASDKVAADLVFAGYGITAKDYGYDDYENIDVKGKVVLVLRYEPPPKDPNSPFKKLPQYSIHSVLRTKADNARDHGAVGMILVDLSNPRRDENELLPPSSSLWRGGRSLVAAQVKRDILENRLAVSGTSLAALKEKIDRTERPASMPLTGVTAEMQVSLAELRRRADNVVAMLPGADPVLRQENIVIGAHYDHLGFGHYGTLDRRASGTVHPGADDNASGTVVLLELARRLANLPVKPARTIVFAAFSGEELGLFGSRHFVDRTGSLASTRAMINLDMVGRLRDNRLTVFGARSGENLSQIVSAQARQLGLELTESDEVGRSDHLSFYNKKIPVLHLFTGIHQDYHRPTDTWEKLNIDGMAKISDLVMATVLAIANVAAPINFVSLPTRRPADSRAAGRSLSVYLGSIPAYGTASDGVELTGVSDGSPAAIAGLRPGDVIIQLADKKIHDIEDLTSALAAQKPGDQVAIVVLRDGQPVTVKATLRAREPVLGRG
ncbi:MAG TPA: M20/M25/M40 family metallo-hydrolase [Candidatus Binatia bacterium]